MKGMVKCFHCKEYDHIKMNCLEHADRNKSDSLSTSLAKEQEEYIGAVIIVSNCMDTFSHNEWILNLSRHVHIC